jgi:hypothetical protein
VANGFDEAVIQEEVASDHFCAVCTSSPDRGISDKSRRCAVLKSVGLGAFVEIVGWTVFGSVNLL